MERTLTKRAKRLWAVVAQLGEQRGPAFASTVRVEWSSQECEVNHMR